MRMNQLIPNPRKKRKSPAPDFDKEIKKLKFLLKEAQARLAPGEEITSEMWEVIKRLRIKSNQ